MDQIDWYVMMMIMMPEGRLKYMHATYRLSTSCIRKGNLGGAGDGG